MVGLSTVTELEDSIHLFNGIYIYIYKVVKKRVPCLSG